MKKINPWALPRPERRVVTREFAADGVTVTLSFRRPDAADMNRAAETAKHLCAEYLYGYPEEGRPPADFPDGIKVSEGLILLCACAEEMQPDEARLYDTMEFIALLDRLPTDGPRIAAFVREMQQDWRARQGESPGAPTASSSAACSERHENTPRSRLDVTSSCQASTPGSAPSLGKVTLPTQPAMSRP